MPLSTDSIAIEEVSRQDQFSGKWVVASDLVGFKVLLLGGFVVIFKYFFNGSLGIL